MEDAVSNLFSVLPSEIVSVIGESLSTGDMMSLSSTSKAMVSCVGEDFWRRRTQDLLGARWGSNKALAHMLESIKNKHSDFQFEFVLDPTLEDGVAQPMEYLDRLYWQASVRKGDPGNNLDSETEAESVVEPIYENKRFVMRSTRFRDAVASVMLETLDHNIPTLRSGAVNFKHYDYESPLTTTIPDEVQTQFLRNFRVKHMHEDYIASDAPRRLWKVFFHTLQTIRLQYESMDGSISLVEEIYKIMQQNTTEFGACVEFSYEGSARCVRCDEPVLQAHDCIPDLVENVCSFDCLRVATIQGDLHVTCHGPQCQKIMPLNRHFDMLRLATTRSSSMPASNPQSFVLSDVVAHSIPKYVNRNHIKTRRLSKRDSSNQIVKRYLASEGSYVKHSSKLWPVIARESSADENTFRFFCSRACHHNHRAGDRSSSYRCISPTCEFQLSPSTAFVDRNCVSLNKASGEFIGYACDGYCASSYLDTAMRKAYETLMEQRRARKRKASALSSNRPLKRSRTTLKSSA